MLTYELVPISEVEVGQTIWPSHGLPGILVVGPGFTVDSVTTVDGATVVTTAEGNSIRSDDPAMLVRRLVV